LTPPTWPDEAKLIANTPRHRTKAVSDLREKNVKDFLGFENLENAVRDDVEWLMDSHALRPDTAISGWVYDVETGETSRVV
jgi:carbonic anhydrase